MRKGWKALIAVAVAVVVVTTTMLVFRPGDAKAQDTELVFHTSPRQVAVEIDGDGYQVEAGEKLTVSATEEIAVTVSRKGFETYTATVKVAPGKANDVHVALLPETDEAWKVVDEEEDLQNEQDTSERYLKDAEKAYDKYPILHELPHEAHLFSASQGLPKTSGYDFGIYLNIYAGHESEGRQAFKNWLSEKGYKFTDYDVVETVKKESPPTAVPESPTMAQLDKANPKGIKIPGKMNRKGLTVDDLALKFAVATTTWDATKDRHPTDGLIRAKGLMDKKMAEATKTPHRLTTTPTWRTAAAAEARSRSWVSEIKTKDRGKNTTMATVEVCWAWISEDEPPLVDGPRTYELTISKKNPAIVRYTYADPDPFVDNSKTSCLPEDA